nr:protein SODIUM POTASSIUM ROOT DEFECTIVE 1 isoform X2 [Ziziphus jujuba var. spinosa]
MKGIDIFCASQASTAICLSMDQASSSSSSIIQLGGRAIDRHNPIIRDERRISRALPSAPCSSQSPINPRAYHQLQKSTKKSNSSARQKDQSKSSSKENDQKKKKKKKKSSSNSKQEDDSIKKSISTTPSDGNVRRSFAKPLDLITPPGSSRYLLSDNNSILFDDYDPVLALASFGNKKNQSVVDQEEAINAAKDDSPSESEPQVVVLRVSLHCKGCEGKVRKHLSRMKAKKVTVVGDVTPLSVLASVSKVKTAQFWPAPAASSAGPAATNTDIKK